MTTPEDEITGSLEEAAAQRGREALRALPHAASDPAFRARLKEAFTSGGISAERPVASRRPAGRASRFPLGLAAAAAVLVAFAFLAAFNPGPQWRVAQIQDAHGSVLINGEPVPADDLESLNEALVGGATLEWSGEGDLELVSPGQVALGIASGTRMTLPAPPPRWFLRQSEGRVEAGTIRLTSGPRFHGAHLWIETPQARVEMTGTTFAVIQEPMGTCVCVLEGAVHVRAGAHDMGMIPAGQRQVVFADGSPTERAEMRPIEKVKLGAMRAAMRAELVKD